MYNPVTLETLVTHDTERRQTKQKCTTQKTKKISNTNPPQNPSVNTDAQQVLTIPASNKTPAMVLI